MMSFSVISPGACSSVRNMGRPTIEGYWWSGKFYEQPLDHVIGERVIGIEYLASVSSLEESGASIEDCII